MRSKKKRRQSRSIDEVYDIKYGNVHINTQDWLAYMEKMTIQLIYAGHSINNETFLTYVLMSLPQEEYQTMILVLKDKLKKGTLTIEEAQN